MIEQTPERTLTRRSVVKGAAWAAPVLALAVATPAATASDPVEPINVGDFSIEGKCSILGLLGPGFDLTAGSAALPIGTTITVSTVGVLELDLLSISGGLATVSALGDSAQIITLTGELGPGQTLRARTVASVSVLSKLTAAVTLPGGYVAGAGAKTTGTLEKTLILCLDD